MLNQTAYRILEEFFFLGLNRLQISQIIKKTGYDFKTVQKYLKELLSLNVIKKLEDLNTPTYEANYRNKYFLNLKRNKMVDDIFQSGLPEYLNKKLGRTACILFGSCARGDYYENSDIDILIQHKKIKLDLREYEEKLDKEINPFFEEKWQNLTTGMQTELLNDGIAINGRLRM